MDAKNLREEQNRQDREWFAKLMEGEDPQKLFRIGVILDAAAILVILMTMLFLNRFWIVCCLGCCAVSVYLAVKYPGYFSLWEDNKGRQERCGAAAFFLMLPFWAPVGVGAVAFWMRYDFESWKPVLLSCAAFTLLAGFLLWLVIPELRRRRQHVILGFALALFVSLGVVLSLNYLLAGQPVDTVSCLVTDSLPGGGKSSPRLVVELPKGEEVGIPVTSDQYQMYFPGVYVEVECFDGGLGIDYYHIP